VFLPIAVQLITFFDTKAVPVLSKLSQWFGQHVPQAIEKVKQFLSDLQANPIVQWIEQKLLGVLRLAPGVLNLVKEAGESLAETLNYLGKNINSIQTYAQAATFALIAFKAAMAVPAV